MTCRDCGKKGKHWYKKYCPDCAKKKGITDPFKKKEV